jgi:hypothetical protein
MKIIIILIICLFFSLSIQPINEFLVATQSPQTAGQALPTQIQTAGQQAPSDGILQTQVNMLSTQITTTNAIAVEAKRKVDDIASQIDQLKEALKKAPDT